MAKERVDFLLPPRSQGGRGRRFDSVIHRIIIIEGEWVPLTFRILISACCGLDGHERVIFFLLHPPSLASEETRGDLRLLPVEFPAN
jgi:hypothetical protein